ncbi:hypothetical protein KEM54_001531 [Ascosphaera aggregata]|nr:hypothetical protein KEM54_001531 [Ascosphaera aggregata]
MATAVLPLEEMKSGAGYMLELIWKHSESHLKETDNQILIPLDIIKILGSENLEVIKSRLSAILHTPTTAIEDTSNGVCRICTVSGIRDQENGASLESDGADIKADGATPTSSKAGKPLQTKRQRIPRPPNAFILYRQHYHPIVKAQNPSFHNNDISKLLGEQWRAESAQRKAEYKALAEQIKKRHAEEYPDYQYAPRKPSERKRRSSARRNVLGKRVSSSSRGLSGPSNIRATAGNVYGSSLNGIKDIPCRIYDNTGARIHGENVQFAAINGPNLLGPYEEQTIINFDCDDYVMGQSVNPITSNVSGATQFTFQNVTEVSNWTPHEFDIESGNYIDFLP